MLNYMRAEFYKVFHRKYIFIFTLVILACEGLLVSGWVLINSRGSAVDFTFGGSTAVMFLSLGLYMLLIIADMVFSDQHKHGTLKNEVSFGIPRVRIYLGKFLVEAILGVALMVIFLVFYELLCWITLVPSAPESAAETLRMVGYSTLVALPQWLGMLAACHMIFTHIRGSAIASFAFIGLLVIPQNIFKAMAFFVDPIFDKLAPLMPISTVEAASSCVGSLSYLGTSWAMGAFWLVASTAIGLSLFRKREIS